MKRKRKPKQNPSSVKPAKVLVFTTVYKESFDKHYKRTKKTFGFQPKCHPKQGFLLKLTNFDLELTCPTCQQHVFTAIVTNPAHKPCHGVYNVTYNGKVLKIHCQTCKKLVHNYEIKKECYY